MKSLTVMRHAKSSWEQEGAGDFDRPLNGRGRRAAKAVGAELKPRIRELDLVLASPAVRVRQTLERFQLAYGNLPEVRFEGEIYLADANTLMRHLRLLNDDINKVMLVGHNPGLHRMLLELSDPCDRLRADVEQSFPTGAAAILELPIERWRELMLGNAEIRALILPRNLL